MGSHKHSFNQRAFVALVAAASGIGLPFTGLANHLLQLEPMTEQRHAWMAAHNIMGVVFVLFATWHVVLNRRAMLGHIRRRAAQLPGLTREAMVAATLLITLVGVVVSHAFLTG